MKQRRGFTLVEVLICIGIVGLLIFPFLEMVSGVNNAYQKSLRQTNLRAELDRVGGSVLAVLRRQPSYSIAANNRAVVLGAGRQLSWNGKELTLTENGKSQPLAADVSHFSIYKRDGVTTLTLAYASP